MEGFYAVYYTGAFGFGHAVLVAKGGVITGADVSGCLYDGKYVQLKDGGVSINIVLTAASGTMLVTGQTVPETTKIEINARLERDFASGNVVTLVTSFGTLNSVFKKIRDLG